MWGTVFDEGFLYMCSRHLLIYYLRWYLKVTLFYSRSTKMERSCTIWMRLTRKTPAGCVLLSVHVTYASRICLHFSTVEISTTGHSETFQLEQNFWCGTKRPTHNTLGFPWASTTWTWRVSELLTVHMPFFYLSSFSNSIVHQFLFIWGYRRKRRQLENWS